MEKIRIKCPFCSAVLETMDNPDNYDKMIICPNCHKKNKFSDFKRVSFSQPSPKDDKTQCKSATKESIGHLVDVSTLQKYPLRLGKNLIGRMTYQTPPKADVPILTSDMGVSREHLYIEVIEGRDGHFHSYAFNAKNKNATLINGNKLDDGDKIGLKHNDVITLCNTNLKYVCALVEDNNHSDDYETEYETKL